MLNEFDYNMDDMPDFIKNTEFFFYTPEESRQRADTVHELEKLTEKIQDEINEKIFAAANEGLYGATVHFTHTDDNFRQLLTVAVKQLKDMKYVVETSYIKDVVTLSLAWHKRVEIDTNKTNENEDK